jgi:pimeloyl-ACP methyl ester carboxylesterase
LLPNGDQFVLACPPPIEASIYETSRNTASYIYPEIAQVKQPVVVMRAAKTRRPDVLELGASPRSPDLARHFANGRGVVLKGASHYIPMESPDQVTEELAKLL